LPVSAQQREIVMYKFLMVLLILALSLSVSAGTITQTQVTGQSYSAGIYQSESNGIQLTHQVSFGSDVQDYQGDCDDDCSTNGTAMFSFSEVVDTVVYSSASSVGVETSSTSFCTAQISTDNLTSGNSSSITNRSRAGFESRESLTLVSGVRIEVEVVSNDDMGYGSATTLSAWESESYTSYGGVTASSVVVTSQSSFIY